MRQLRYLDLMFGLALSVLFLGVVGAAPPSDESRTPTAASATPSEDSANLYRASASSKLLRAKRLVQELEYEQAREMVLEVLADPRAKPAERFSAAMLSGRIHVILERDVTARLHFRTALDIVPDADLPKGDPPKIRAFFEAVKAEHAAERARVGTKSETPASSTSSDEPPSSGTTRDVAGGTAPAEEGAGVPYLTWGGAGLAAASTAVGAVSVVGGLATHFLIVQNVGMDVAVRNVARPAVLGAMGMSAVAIAAAGVGCVVAVVGWVEE